MANPFLAEIRIFPFYFAPRGWAFCDGQILPISQNTALFSLLGTTYGGDGVSNFALPNLQGSTPIGAGQGTGLSLRNLGESGGEAEVSLLVSEIPAHHHRAKCHTAAGDRREPAANYWAGEAGASNEYAPSTDGSEMAAGAVGTAGGSMPHNNLQPYLTLNFCIALEGIFPARD